MVPTLINSINLCHFLSLIQCLFALPPFVSALKQSAPNDLRRLHAACTTELPVNPREICREFGLSFEQEDAFETFDRLLSYLIAKAGTAKRLELHPSFRQSTLHTNAFKHWNGYLEGRYCPLVHATFATQTYIRIGKSDSFDAFAVLRLPIVDEALEKCIDAYFADEHVEFEKKKQTRIQKLWNLPAVLVIQLKRFVNTGEKNRQPVRYPLQLDLIQHTSLQVRISGARYHLCAVLCHKGETHSGHCYAIVYDGSRWTKVDDDRQSKCPPEDVNAYGLFYVRARNQRV